MAYKSLAIFAPLLVGIIAGFLLWNIFSHLIAPTKDPAVQKGTTSTLAIAATSTPSSIRVPILVYHIVRPSYQTDSQAVKSIAVTPELFDQEMGYLKSNGYMIVPFSALEAYFYQGVSLPPRAVILTFDDAWEDQYTYAFPILEKYHYTATFFIPSNFPGHTNFLTWNQLRTMVADGISVGSHSESHPYLTASTSSSTLWREIDGSKEILQQQLGVSVNEFNYPFGMFNATTVEMVKKAGYKAARADYLGLVNSSSTLFKLGALTAPTTLEEFEKYFPPHR